MCISGRKGKQKNTVILGHNAPNGRFTQVIKSIHGFTQIYTDLTLKHTLFCIHIRENPWLYSSFLFLRALRLSVPPREIFRAQKKGCLNRQPFCIIQTI